MNMREIISLVEQVVYTNGSKFIIHKNPPKGVFQNILNTSLDGELRGLLVRNGDLYVWDSYYGTHDRAVDCLEIEDGFHLYLLPPVRIRVSLSPLNNLEKELYTKCGSEPSIYTNPGDNSKIKEAMVEIIKNNPNISRILPSPEIIVRI